MRFIRLAALVGSLVLLVATAISVVNRRGDIRDEQAADVARSAELVSLAVRNTVDQLRHDVHLAALAATNPALDDRALADELVRFFPGAEACSGDASGCTGANLFSLGEVADLANQSAQATPQNDVPALAQIGVDDNSQSLLVVRSVATDDGEGRVAMRVPVKGLVSGQVRTEVSDSDATVGVATRAQDADDVVYPLERDGDLSTMVETIGSPFAFGSLDVTLESTRSLGIAGDATARYATLLALGTVLLALAGWTYVVERRQLERRATTDELTGLINRREFERVSEEALDNAHARNTGLCVMVIDLNGFKQVNDTLGHQFGDLVLAASAERLVDAVRDTDVVGRWGGDEFVIMLPGLAERTAVRNRAERIWQLLSGTPVVGDTTMSASIGAAIYPRHGTTLDALMRAADVAMYEAKTTGVSHRIADTIAVNESLLAESQPVVDDEPIDGEIDPTDPPKPIISDNYVGADRRRSPVPPPPQPPSAAFPPPDAPDVVPTPTSSDS